MGAIQQSVNQLLGIGALAAHGIRKQVAEVDVAAGESLKRAQEFAFPGEDHSKYEPQPMPSNASIVDLVGDIRNKKNIDELLTIQGKERVQNDPEGIPTGIAGEPSESELGEPIYTMTSSEIQRAQAEREGFQRAQEEYNKNMAIKKRHEDWNDILKEAQKYL